VRKVTDTKGVFISRKSTKYRQHNDHKKKELEIEALERERDGARKRYKAELSVQARFNSANNNSILRLREKFGD
jgi:hypothetical protein